MDIKTIYISCKIQAHHIAKTESKTDIPHEYICPITKRIMIFPIETVEGRVYEEDSWDAIKLNDDGTKTDPWTRNHVSAMRMPKIQLRVTIKKFVKDNWKILYDPIENYSTLYSLSDNPIGSFLENLLNIELDPVFMCEKYFVAYFMLLRIQKLAPSYLRSMYDTYIENMKDVGFNIWELLYNKKKATIEDAQYFDGATDCKIDCMLIKYEDNKIYERRNFNPIVLRYAIIRHPNNSKLLEHLISNDIVFDASDGDMSDTESSDVSDISDDSSDKSTHDEQSLIILAIHYNCRYIIKKYSHYLIPDNFTFALMNNSYDLFRYMQELKPTFDIALLNFLAIKGRIDLIALMPRNNVISNMDSIRQTIYNYQCDEIIANFENLNNDNDMS